MTEQLAKQHAKEEQFKNTPKGVYPAILNASVEDANTVPPIPFDSQVFQNDMNNSFDHKILLKRVPSKFQDRAKALIYAFDERPNDLTWDSAGNVFVNQVSLPGADIYEIFPKLFQKNQPKRMKGFLDVVNQIKTMGLLHLIHHPSHNVQVEAKSRSSIDQLGSGKEEQKQGPTKMADQWWYIGD